MKHIVVQDIKSETKVGKSVYLFDFFFEIRNIPIDFSSICLYNEIDV